MRPPKGCNGSYHSLAHGPAGADGGARIASVVVPVAQMPLLDVYHCEWTGMVGGNTASWSSDHELVGAHLCEISAIRATVFGIVASAFFASTVSDSVASTAWP